VERLVKWARRRPAVAALLMGILLVAALGSGVSLYFGSQAREQARKANDRARDSEEALGREKVALDRVETTLVRSILRPLGYERGGFTDAERDALWDLARTDSEGVRLRFFEEGLARPDIAERLGRRAEAGVRAAVGLDVDRRQSVLRLVGAASMDGPGAAKAAEMALKVMASTSDPQRLAALVQAVGALAARMDGPAAAKAAERALDTMAETAAQPFMLEELGQVVAGLAARMDGPAAAKAADQAAARILDAMAKTTELDTLVALGQAVGALATRMDIPANVRAADGATLRVLDAMTETTDPRALDNLEAAAPLLARLHPQGLVDLLKRPTCTEKARRAVVDELGRRMGRKFNDLWEMVDWAREHEPTLDLTSPPESRAPNPRPRHPRAASCPTGCCKAPKAR
jgi:hypothetical protein